MVLSLSDLIQQWPAIATGITGLGGGGLLVKLLEHQRAKRQQTDEVALGLVDKLKDRIDKMEVAHEIRIDKMETAATHEREVCDARLSSLRHELRNVAANFDGLLLALKYAAPERIQEIVADVLSRRHAAIQKIPVEPTLA